jgi:nifR3 family TIM-barrel protein
MANITTLPFRSICKEMGANVVYTPMLSSNAITHNTEKTLKVAEFLPEEQPVIVQIFGYSGELIAKVANIVDKKLKPAGIDINMGCPAPKITGNECGSALLRDLDKALEITKEVREKYDGQLSVKLRLGWNGFDILDFVKKLEEIGIDSVSIHGRTTKQGYRGEANWEAIEEIAGAVDIPVIGNGDITTWQEADARLNGSKLAGIMIGRATLGNPWLFKEITEKRDIEVDKKELTRVITLQQSAILTILERG